MSNVDPKIYTSLLAGKILLRANDFLPLKVYYTLVSTLDAVQICRNFSPLGYPPYAKKSKRDSLHFDLLPGPFKRASFYFIFVHSSKDIKEKTIL